MGNRVSKVAVRKNGTGSFDKYKITYYLRDASGNTMSVYEKSVKNAGEIADLLPTEYHIYGSSRLGMYTPTSPTGGLQFQENTTTRARSNMWAGSYFSGDRTYEFSDHLGNVHAVVSDSKETVSATEYYPFGMAMQTYIPGYRYGFNGKELDPEGMGGGGSTLDYGFRIYNPQLGKFLSVDPLAKSYPWNSTYAFAENDVIRSIDLDGLEKRVIITDFSGRNGNQITYELEVSDKVRENIYKVYLSNLGEEHVTLTEGMKAYNLSGYYADKMASDNSQLNLTNIDIKEQDLALKNAGVLLIVKGQDGKLTYHFTEDEASFEDVKKQAEPLTSNNEMPFEFRNWLRNRGIPENEPDAVKLGVNISLGGANVAFGYATSTKEGGVYGQWDFNPNTNPTILSVTAGPEMIYFTTNAKDRSLNGAISGSYTSQSVGLGPVSLGAGQGYGDDGKQTTKSFSVGVGVSGGYSSYGSKASGGVSKGTTVFKKVTD